MIYLRKRHLYPPFAAAYLINDVTMTFVMWIPLERSTKIYYKIIKFININLLILNKINLLILKYIIKLKNIKIIL